MQIEGDPGTVQAVRVLVFELLRAHASHPAVLLPRLLAALVAWPAALPELAAGTDAVGRVVHAAVLDVTRDVLRAPPRPPDETATALGPLEASTAEATCGADVVGAARQLWEMGRRRWGWGAQDTLGLGFAGSSVGAPQWGALQGVLRELLAASSAHPQAVLPFTTVRALELGLACAGSAVCHQPVRASCAADDSTPSLCIHHSLEQCPCLTYLICNAGTSGLAVAGNEVHLKSGGWRSS